MQRDKLTADPKYFTTCQDSILIVHFDASFNQHQHGNNLSALNAHMTIWNIVRYKADMYWTEEKIEWKETPIIHLIRGRCTKGLINKNAKGYTWWTQSPQHQNWQSQPITWKDRSYRSTTSDVMSWTTQASYWTPKGSEINEHPNRMSKSEAKINISEDEKKAVIIIQTQMGCWLTDVATNHQVTNQQPNDYKEPINKSEDKVRGYNNTVNKYMSSEREENFIRQNQFTVILATDTSQCKGRADTYCTIYNWYNHHGVEWIQKLPIY